MQSLAPSPPAPAPQRSNPVDPRRWLALPQGRLVTLEGVWGAGKTTAARLVSTRLREAGVTTAVIHYGSEPGTIGRLSQFLETAPLRSRTGLGGYQSAHHSTVDVLLRLCREAHHHLTCFGPALATNDVVLVDHGIYSKIAWALTVLTETDPQADPAQTLTRIRGLSAPWFCTPDVPVFLDTPWPLARERAISRGHGGGNPAAIERLLFLPRYVAAYRQVLTDRVPPALRVRVGLRDSDDVADEITSELLGVLRAASPAADQDTAAQPHTPVPADRRH
ncbi:dTMP kinase [Micromonospora haikouensis]|uniref:dTMP kinase n=1 Tax=Micromonospora haikouensis TaxID=686309 RepID=UPI003D754D90